VTRYRRRETHPEYQKSAALAFFDGFPPSPEWPRADRGLRRDRPNRRSGSVRRTAAAVSANPPIGAANPG
jgi:hypothetical protein